MHEHRVLLVAASASVSVSVLVSVAIGDEVSEVLAVQVAAVTALVSVAVDSQALLMCLPPPAVTPA